MSVWWGEKENWIGLCITHKKCDLAHPCATSPTATTSYLLVNDFTNLPEEKKKPPTWRFVDPAWKFISIETVQMELEYSGMTYSK